MINYKYNNKNQYGGDKDEITTKSSSAISSLDKMKTSVISSLDTMKTTEKNTVFINREELVEIYKELYIDSSLEEEMLTKVTIPVNRKIRNKSQKKK